MVAELVVVVVFWPAFLNRPGFFALAPSLLKCFWRPE